MDEMKHEILLQLKVAVGLRALIRCPFITMSNRCLEDLDGVISDDVDTPFGVQDGFSPLTFAVLLVSVFCSEACGQGH
jgi:hypothetical protein